MDARPSFQQSSLLKSPFVVFIFAIAAVFLLVYNVTLQKQNQSLLKKAQALQRSLETIETEHKTLIDRTEKERAEFAALKEENQTLQTDLKKVADDLAAAEDEKTYLEEILITRLGRSKISARIRSLTQAPTPSPVRSVKRKRRSAA